MPENTSRETPQKKEIQIAGGIRRFRQGTQIAFYSLVTSQQLKQMLQKACVFLCKKVNDTTANSMNLAIALNIV